MALSRKQKRWLRQHRGLVNCIKALVVILVLCLGYFIATLFNENLKISNLLKNNENTQTESNGSSEGTTQSATKAPEYVSMLYEFKEEEPDELTKAATEYVPAADDKNPYLIKVNRASNCVTVYGKDENGYYSIPVKAFVCSSGKNVGDTPLGNGSITDKYTFHPMVDGTYGQFAVRFMSGGILFHSVPYYTNKKDQLETDQFNLLGSPASLGCVRLCVRDSLWIYENCPKGTDVVVYDDETNPGPLGKPEMIKIPVNSQFAGWDPTDPDENNPWRQYSAVIEGTVDRTVNIGDTFDPMEGIVAVDTCGNVITDRVKLVGSYDLGIPGVYSLTYKVEDLIGSTDSKTVTITVVDSIQK